MEIRSELRAWADDAARRHRTQSAIDRFGAGWSRGPVQARLDAALAADPKPSAAALARSACALFADDGWVADLIGALAAEMRRDPFFEPPFPALNSDIHSGLVLYENDHVSLALGLCAAARLAAKKNGRRGRTSVGFTGEVSVLKFVKAGGARLSFWEAPLITAEFSAARAGRCRRTGERLLADGEVLIVDGRFEAYAIDHARSNLMVLQAAIRAEAAPLSVEYDSATGEYVGCSATDDGASRIQMITTLVRRLGRDSAFPAVAAFLGHPAFFVRWHVMRELLGLDAAAALPHLKAMAAADPHPENRHSARSVLDRLAPMVEAA